MAIHAAKKLQQYALKAITALSMNYKSIKRENLLLELTWLDKVQINVN